MSGGLLKALRSDSYVELSQYRDQHFRVREAGSREGGASGQNAETRFALPPGKSSRDYAIVNIGLYNGGK
ncbi:hypothetical protein FD754_005616 [Muntiacus muntjak]|uniref:Uncharacterized protein n=1 Tax=Muntiacus muntjak TaxID=9888 RepID=A0A5N3WI49_MUNMU|nr:hypothetical protein FD754_005616 [Muntiacus muntjak]